MNSFEKVSSISFESQDKENQLSKFKKELETEYGKEFVQNVFGVSEEGVLEITPFGVNYEVCIREFVRSNPTETQRISDAYSKSHDGRPHVLIEKALAQIEYINSANLQDKKTNFELSPESRVYYDRDGYPNISLDPEFYELSLSLKSAGVSSSKEIFDQFSKSYPYKSSFYKIGLQNKERWKIEGKNVQLSEHLNEIGIETMPIVLDCDGAEVSAVIFPKKPQGPEKLIRVYRGVTSATPDIVRQLPYAARGEIEFTQEGNYQLSVIKEIPNIEEEVTEIANNPSMKSLLAYYHKVYDLLPEESKEILDKKMKGYAKDVIDGFSLSHSLSMEQVSGGMYSAEFLTSPFVSATPKIDEAWRYGRAGVIVYEVPESMVSNLSSRYECMLHGTIPPEYISMFVHNRSNFSLKTDILERSIDTSLGTRVYSNSELDSLGSKILERRLAQEDAIKEENLRLAKEFLGIKNE